MVSHKVFFIASLAIAVNSTVGQTCKGGAECVRLDSCSVLYSGLIQNKNPQYLRLLQGLHCGFEAYDQPKVCCPPEFSEFNLTSRFGGITPYTESVNPFDLLPSTKVCGIQNNNRNLDRVETNTDEHPWTVLLRYEKPYGWGFQCSGVLISSKYILTSASCVNGPDLPSTWRLTQVRLGEWNTSSVKSNGRSLDVPVEEVIAHDNYEPDDENQRNDIALLRLAQDIQFTDFVKPICLPLTFSLRNMTFEGYYLEVAGWGETGSRFESDVKLKAREAVVAMSECPRFYRLIGRNITNEQLCTTSAAGQGLRRGDSGGALMGRVPDIDSWLVIGVVSYGPLFYGAHGWPRVYTRVGAYVDWIISNLKP